MNNIKEARINAGYSQKQVALELKVSIPTVSEWESGKKIPSTSNLKKLCKIFNVSADYILGLVKEPIRYDFETKNIISLHHISILCAQYHVPSD